MKIGLVVKDFHASRGGGEKYSVTLAGELARKGHEITLFSRSFADRDVPGKKVFVAAKKMALSRSYAFARAAQKQILHRRSSLDIVYGLTQVFPCDFLRLGGGLIAFWEKQKYAGRMWRRFFNPGHILNKKLERRMLFHRDLKKVVVNSQMVAGHLKEFYHFPARRIQLIRNGVDGDYFSPDAVEKDFVPENFRKLKDFSSQALTLLFLSNNYQRKGLFEILDFMASQKEGRDIHLIIAGRGNISKISRFCREKQISRRVFCAGFCEDVRPLFLWADIFVLPTYYDPFANVCLEAAVFGLPVVTTAANGFSELIENGKNGIVMESPDDFMNLKKALQVFSRRKSFEKTCPECRNAVIHLTPEMNAQETLRLFKEKYAE